MITALFKLQLWWRLRWSRSIKQRYSILIGTYAIMLPHRRRMEHLKEKVLDLEYEIGNSFPGSGVHMKTQALLIEIEDSLAQNALTEDSAA